MKKLFPVITSLLLLGCFIQLRLSHEIDPRLKFDLEMAMRIDAIHNRLELPKSSGSQHPKALEFDRLKRIDPATGEIPPFAITRAYRQVQAMAASEKTTGNALTWQERGPDNVGGRTRGIMWDPNDPTNKAAFAGGVGGGLWYNSDVTNPSTVWTNVNPMFSNIAVTTIAHDPTNTSIMYFGTGEDYNNADQQQGAGIWRSMDGGLTFDVLPATENNSFEGIQKILVDSSGQVYAGTSDGLWKSTDNGDTWTKVGGAGLGQGSNYVNDIELASDGDLFVAFRSDGIWESPASSGATQGDAGTWTILNTNFTAGFARVEFAISPLNPDYMYAVTVVSNAVDQFYRSLDGGATWSPTSSEPGGSDFSNGQAWYDLTIEVNPDFPDIIYSGAVPNYRSSNRGDSWSSLGFMHVDQHNLKFRPGTNDEILFSNDGGVYFSSNGGVSSTDRNNGYNVTQYYAIAIDPRPGSNIVIGGTQDNGTQMLSTPGIGSADQINGSDGGYCAIDYISPDTMYVTTQYQTVRRSRNGGIFFSSITNPSLSSGDVLFINPLEIDPNDPDIIYQASTSLWRHPYASTGSGSLWQQATKSLASSITAIGCAVDIPHLVYVAAGGSVYRIENAHTTTSAYNPDRLSPPGSGYIHCVAVDPNDGNHIIVTYSSYGSSGKVYETFNAEDADSANWKALHGNLPFIPITWAVFEPNNPNGVLLGTELGAFRCGDVSVPESDIYWSPERTGMGFPRIDMLKVRESDNYVFAGTHGRGIFETGSYNSPPTAAFGLVADSVCGGIVEFIDSTFNAPSSWHWDFGDGDTSTLQSPMHEYDSSGTYAVELIVSNANGADTISKSINIVYLTPVTASFSTDTAACPGETVPLSASGGVSYLWSPSEGLDDPTSATPTATVEGVRIYTCVVTAANGCTASGDVTVSVLSTPSVWAGSDKEICLDVDPDSVELTGFGGEAFLWTPAAGLSCDTCQNPMAFPDTTTTYTLVSTAANGCSASDMVTVTVDSCLKNRPDPLDNSTVRLQGVFPNPAVGNSVIGLRVSEVSDVKLDIVNMNGQIVREVYRGKVATGEQRIDLDQIGLRAGLYFVRLESEGRTEIRKFTIIQ